MKKFEEFNAKLVDFVKFCPIFNVHNSHFEDNATKIMFFFVFLRLTIGNMLRFR